MGKYYYGNSYKEALGNSPITIKTEKQLRQYQDNYTWVIPVEETLPENEEMEIDSCLADAIEDTDHVEECINKYLSDKYGYCADYYDYKIVDDKIKISSITWEGC